LGGGLLMSSRRRGGITPWSVRFLMSDLRVMRGSKLTSHHARVVQRTGIIGRRSTTG
jgi:hypothetical protein